jgi:hypothetical protein
MKPNQVVKFRSALLVVACAVLAPLAQAQQVVVADAHARGVSVLGVESSQVDGGYAVRARVSRSLMKGVLSPVTLQVVIRDASGAVKAERQTLLGPAALPRNRLRSFSFESRFEQAPAVDDVVEVSLVHG